MRLYHRTSDDRARSILAIGFVDGSGTYMTRTTHTGVWLSDTPLDPNEGTLDGPLLAIELDLPGSEIAEFEWVEEGKGYREFLMPAALVNAQGVSRLVSDDEEEQILRDRLAKRFAELYGDQSERDLV